VHLTGAQPGAAGRRSRKATTRVPAHHIVAHEVGETSWVGGCKKHWKSRTPLADRLQPSWWTRSIHELQSHLGRGSGASGCAPATSRISRFMASLRSCNIQLLHFSPAFAGEGPWKEVTSASSGETPPTLDRNCLTRTRANPDTGKGAWRRFSCAEVAATWPGAPPPIPYGWFGEAHDVPPLYSPEGRGTAKTRSAGQSPGVRRWIAKKRCAKRGAVSQGDPGGGSR